MSILDQYCDLHEAAETLGCTTARVRQLLRDGTLQGEKLSDGPNAPWFVLRRSLKSHARLPYTTGRPRKSQAS